MQPKEARFTIRELAALAGVTRRTVHYYIELGLLPPPIGRGRHSYYTMEHLRRLRIIRQLRRYFYPLKYIKQVLQIKSVARLEEELARDLAPPREARVCRPKSLPSERTTWERLVLTDGLEIHYRLPAPAEVARFIESVVGTFRTEALKGRE